MQWVMNYIVLHWFWGLGLGLVFNFAIFKQKRWRPFRFGGESPFSLGEKNWWLLWYGVAYIVEKVTSLWFGNQIYVEFAMSAIEAGGLTVGLFMADRFSMIFEPESNWMPRRKAEIEQQVPRVEAPQEQKAWVGERVEAASEQVAATAKDFKNTAEDLKENTIGAVAEVGEKTKEKVSGLGRFVKGFWVSRREKADAAKKAKEDAAESDRKKRVERFKNLTKGY